MPDEIRDHDEEFVQRHVAELMQHFDAVQVFVTRQEPSKSTMACSIGDGNYYSRLGMIAEWVGNGGAINLNETAEDSDG